MTYSPLVARFYVLFRQEGLLGRSSCRATSLSEPAADGRGRDFKVEKGAHGAMNLGAGNKCIFLLFPQKPSISPLVCLAWAAAARLSTKAVSGMVSSFPLLNRPRMATDGSSDVFDGITAGKVRLQLSFLSLVQPPDALGVSFRVNVGVNLSFAPWVLGSAPGE